MKIQFLNGGLGNQAFQYIFAKYYELSHPGELMYMDDSYFALHTVHNGYELEKVFGIRPHMLSECFDEDVWNYMLLERQKGKSIPQILCDNGMNMCMVSEVGDGYKNFNPFDGVVYPIADGKYVPDILDDPKNVYYHGYWLNKNWFTRYRDIFLKEFTFPEITDEKNKSYLNAIKSTYSVSLHIRRGDYVKLGYSYECSYYRNIIRQFTGDVGNQWVVFVFSDEPEWCKANRRELGLDCFKEVVFVEGNVDGRNYIDIQLMSQCKGMFVSNSAFCFLAALLNTEKKAYLNTTLREV